MHAELEVLKENAERVLGFYMQRTAVQGFQPLIHRLT